MKYRKFTLYPAIDIKNGKCVRLLFGDMERETIYHENPLDQAMWFVDQGADWLHIVDLDGAVEGNDPELFFKLGSKIDFIVNAPGHPFLLKFKAGIGKKNQIDGIENNGSSKGTISWTPSEAGTYYYQCGKHKNMVGVIKII